MVGHQGVHMKDSEVILRARNQGLKKVPQVKPHSWFLLLEPQAMRTLVCQHWIPQGSQLRIPSQLYHQVKFLQCMQLQLYIQALH